MQGQGMTAPLPSAAARAYPFTGQLHDAGRQRALRTAGGASGIPLPPLPLAPFFARRAALPAPSGILRGTGKNSCAPLRFAGPLRYP